MEEVEHEYATINHMKPELAQALAKPAQTRPKRQYFRRGSFLVGANSNFYGEVI